MNFKELRNEHGKLLGIVVATQDIGELQNSLKDNSQLTRDLNVLLVQEGEDSGDIMPNGLTVAETNLKMMKRVETLYKEAFSKGVAMYYRDERCQSPKEFIRANPDGSEDLVSFDRYTRIYTLIKQLVLPGEGYWAYLS